MIWMISTLLVLYTFYKLVSKMRASLAGIGQSKRSPSRRTSSRIIAANHLAIARQTDDGDGFATFTLQSSTVGACAPSANRSAGRWVGQQEHLVIAGRHLPYGFVYIGGELTALNGDALEPALLDPQREIAPVRALEQLATYSDDSLGYWPHFASLSPECRGAYLDWLSTDRCHPDMPIGYVFLYFYGLERRVLDCQQQPDDAEYVALYEEVWRLYQIYRHNRSFEKYASGFLQLMMGQRPQLLARQLAQLAVADASWTFKLKLAQQVVAGQGCDAELAWAWLVHHEQYHFKTPATRCPDLFRQLFDHYFNEKFADGMKIKVNKKPLCFTYQPANSGMKVFHCQVEGLPDPSELKGPFKKLSAIADQCTEALNAYSRYLADPQQVNRMLRRYCCCRWR